MGKIPKSLEQDSIKIPERNLWAKVLEMSIRDALKGNPQARNWIMSSSTKPFSFIWACEVLGFVPTALREVIIKQKMEFLKNI